MCLRQSAATLVVNSVTLFVYWPLSSTVVTSILLGTKHQLKRLLYLHSNRQTKKALWYNMIKCFQQTISFTLRHKTNNTTCEWAIFLIIYMSNVVIYLEWIYSDSITFCQSGLRWITQVKHPPLIHKHSIGDLVTLPNVGLQWTLMELTDSFNPPHFQNISTAEAKVSQKKNNSKNYNQLNPRTW